MPPSESNQCEDKTYFKSNIVQTSDGEMKLNLITNKSNASNTKIYDFLKILYYKF